MVLRRLLLGSSPPHRPPRPRPTQILRDCADDGDLQGDYSPSELRDARQNIPSDIDEYTDCRDVLARAASAGVVDSGRRVRRPGRLAAARLRQRPVPRRDNEPPADPRTPEGRQIVGEAGGRATGRRPVTIGGRPVVPGHRGPRGRQRAQRDPDHA